MRTEEMNKGLQILLERIKSNPEEFTPDIAGRYPEKWRNFLQQVEARANGEVPKYLDFLSDAEIAELWHAMQEVRGDQFTRQVMDTLLRDGELSFTSDQGLGETQKNKIHRVKAIDIKLAKELGMTLSEYVKRKEELGIET
jgi:hypothetical protein